MKRNIPVLLIFILLSACKKDIQETNDAEYYPKLVDKKWTVVADIEEDGSGQKTDVYQTWNIWDVDDYYTWYSNGQYVVNDGQYLHPGSTQQILDSGAWKLSNSVITESSLNTTGRHYPSTIVTISTDTLFLKIFYDNRNVTSYVTLIPK